jgi:acetylornithine deacetylase
MKGFIACAIHTITAQDKANLDRPVHLCLTHDEETDCSGIKTVVAQMGKTLPRPDVAIVGEPTGMNVVSGHKGVREFEVRIQGKSAHGSMPQSGVNAISLGARAITRLDEIGLRLAAGASQNPRFTPPYTTLNIGMARGGTASNIIPDRFTFIGDIRAIPQDDPDRLQTEFDTWIRRELLPSVGRNAQEASIGIDIICDIPPFHPQIDSAAERLVRKLTGDTEERVVAFGSEAGILQAADVASVLVGPGSMEQGHTADEYVDVAQLEACRHFLRRLLNT